MFPVQNGTTHDGARSAVADGKPRAARVPAVYKAFRLLETVSGSEKPLGVSELARKLQMGKSTVHGLVTTLEALGVLESVPGKRYAIGPLLRVLAAGAAQQPDLRRMARPALERLAEDTELTTFLGIPADSHVTIVDIVHGTPTLAISAQVGTTIPLLAGAVGKVVLASWESERRRSFLHETTLPAFTPQSIVSPDGYERAVAETLARGAAIDCDEYVDGVRAAAAPINGPEQRLLAVLWVAGFSRHIDDGRLDRVAAHVQREASQISERLGAGRNGSDR